MSKKDPWKHRSEHMLCWSCMYYVEKAKCTQDENKAIGRCRRHAPTLNGYPVVYESDWCGDHKMNEERI